MKSKIDPGTVDYQDYIDSLSANGEMQDFLREVDAEDLVTALESCDYVVYGHGYDILEDFSDDELREELGRRKGARLLPSDDFVFDACTDLRTALRDGKRDEALKIAEEIYRNVLGVAV